MAHRLLQNKYHNIINIIKTFLKDGFIREDIKLIIGAIQVIYTSKEVFAQIVMELRATNVGESARSWQVATEAIHNYRI